MNQSLMPKLSKELSQKIKIGLVHMGFDFAKMGSRYLQDVLLEVLLKPSLLHSFSTEVLIRVAEAHERTYKSVERTIRWAISDAYKVNSTMRQIQCFRQGKVPTIKQIVNFLFDYFVEFDYVY